MIRIVGIGCRANASETSLREAIEMALVSAPPGPLEILATTREKAESEVVKRIAKHFRLTLTAVESEDLRGIETITRSERIMARFGTGSLSEASALFAAGYGGSLRCARQIASDGMATAAIAEGDGL